MLTNQMLQCLNAMKANYLFDIPKDDTKYDHSFDQLLLLALTNVTHVTWIFFYC